MFRTLEIWSRSWWTLGHREQWSSIRAQAVSEEFSGWNISYEDRRMSRMSRSSISLSWPRWKCLPESHIPHSGSEKFGEIWCHNFYEMRRPIRFRGSRREDPPWRWSPYRRWTRCEDTQFEWLRQESPRSRGRAISRCEARRASEIIHRRSISRGGESPVVSLLCPRRSPALQGEEACCRTR